MKPVLQCGQDRLSMHPCTVVAQTSKVKERILPVGMPQSRKQAKQLGSLWDLPSLCKGIYITVNERNG
eukprot:153593-Pelagomonas_calceolata.AAC.1